MYNLSYINFSKIWELACLSWCTSLRLQTVAWNIETYLSILFNIQKVFINQFKGLTVIDIIHNC